MKYWLLTAVLLFTALFSFAQVAQPSFGRIQRFEKFPSKFVEPRHVDVWLPEGYDSSQQYAVLYMHDGQMLFDSSLNWNHQEWGVDETLTALMQSGKIRPCIVVGIWSNGWMRHPEYAPQKPFGSLTEADKKVVQEALYDAHRVKDAPFQPISDRYLKFLVTELKPFIDSHFSTLRNRGNTFIAGSSMGGLISLYAMCEYPTVFGGAACLSTHWTGIFRNDNNPIPAALLAYLDKHLPTPKGHRFYFDYGSETLDSLYAPTQLKVDALMKKKGFTYNWMTKSYPGENHSERAWASRLAIPMSYLMTNFGSQDYEGNPIVWDGHQYWGNIKEVTSTTYRAADSTHRPILNERAQIIRFNEKWEVASAFNIQSNGDTTALPTPLYNEFGSPVLSTWLKKDGSLNSFEVNEYEQGQLKKTSNFSWVGHLSNVVEFEYHGDTTIARKYYYDSLQKAIDYKRWEKTVTVTSHGNPISIVCTQKNGIIYALFTEYTRFDQYGNWSECRSKGEVFGEFTELVTVRTITYFQ